MGRKNRNARSNGYSYTSFENLKNTTLRFDLSNGDFFKKDTAVQATEHDEVRVSFNKCGHKQDSHVSFSFREDIAETMTKGDGRHWICGIVKEGLLERIYFVPDSIRGYAMYQNKNASKRQYLRFPVYENASKFEKFLGTHELKYDNANKAYYIQPE